MLKLRENFGYDPSGQGFFWPESSSKKIECLSTRRTSPDTFESTYQCRPGKRIGSVFVESDFSWYDSVPGMDQGISNPFVREFISRGIHVGMAFDCAEEIRKENDFTVGIAGLFMPCETYHREEDPELIGICEPHWDVYILDLIRRKVSVGDIYSIAREFFMKWRPSLPVIIEKKSSGSSLISSFEKAEIPVEPTNPSDSKRTRATMHLGAGSVQGWFKLHRVLFPKTASWLSDFMDEIKDFTGDGSGHDDQVDALVNLVTYGIRYGGSGTVGVIKNSIDIPRETNPNSPDQESIALLFDAHSDPFFETCARCRSYDPKTSECSIWNRKFPSLNSCPEFDARIT